MVISWQAIARGDSPCTFVFYSLGLRGWVVFRLRKPVLLFRFFFSKYTFHSLSLRTQPTFGDATTAKWRLRNEPRNSRWRVTAKSGWWRVISMEFLRWFLRRHLTGKPVVASPNVGCFLRLYGPLSVPIKQVEFRENVMGFFSRGQSKLSVTMRCP